MDDDRGYTKKDAMRDTDATKKEVDRAYDDAKKKFLRERELERSMTKAKSPKGRSR